MSNVKKGAYFNLNLEALKHLKVLASEMKMSQGEVIEYFIEKNIKGRSEEHKLLKDTISTLFKEELSPVISDLNRIRVASNVIDRNVQMTMEFWNHYFLVNDFKALGTIEKIKTGLFREAEVHIQERIAHNRQRKLDWESKRKQKDNEE